MNYRRIFAITVALLFVVQQTPAQIFQVPGVSVSLASPGPIGATTPSAGAFTTLSATTATQGMTLSNSSATVAVIQAGPAAYMRLRLTDSGGAPIQTAGGISLGSLVSLDAGDDTILLRDAANTLALRNGTNAQTFNLYGTYTDASNFRQGSIADSTGGVLTISSSGLGTGANSNTITLKVTSSGGAAVDALVLDNAGNGTFNSSIQVGGASGPRVRSGSTFVDVTNSAQNAYLPLVFTLRATGAAAPTIASAGTIAPTTPIVFISGTAAIATITAPSPISAGGGDITLVPTGIFTTTTAGNIALASTAVVSKALRMVYDATTAKWYPSY